MGRNYDEVDMPNKETPSPSPYAFVFDAAFFRLALHRAGYDPYDTGTGSTVWAKTTGGASKYADGDVMLLSWLDAPLTESSVIVVDENDGGYIVSGRHQL